MQKKMSRIFFFSLQSRAVTQTSLARTSCRIEIDAGNKTPEFFFFLFPLNPLRTKAATDRMDRRQEQKKKKQDSDPA